MLTLNFSYKQNGIKVSEKIIPNWLSRCDVVRSIVPPSEAERVLEFNTSAINEHLGLKSGDYVWVSRRNAEPEVWIHVFLEETNENACKDMLMCLLFFLMRWDREAPHH